MGGLRRVGLSLRAQNSSSGTCFLTFLSISLVFPTGKGSLDSGGQMPLT